MSVDEKRGLIESGNKEINIRRQCELVGLTRSNWYYTPAEVSDETLRLMRRVDEIFTEYPFYGSRRIREALRREGFEVGREWVQGCMSQMGLRAIYPKGNMSKRQQRNHPFKSGMGKRHNIPAAEAWICVPCSNNGLV